MCSRTWTRSACFCAASTCFVHRFNLKKKIYARVSIDHSYFFFTKRTFLDLEFLDKGSKQFCDMKEHTFKPLWFGIKFGLSCPCDTCNFVYMLFPRLLKSFFQVLLLVVKNVPLWLTFICVFFAVRSRTYMCVCVCVCVCVPFLSFSKFSL